MKTPALLRITDLLPAALIKVDLQSDTKDELFEEMVQVLVANGLLRDRAAALRALWEREAKMSTGVGHGLALPHGKIAEARELLLAMGVSRRGIDYDALDGEPVHVVVLVLAEVGNPGPHIQALAEVSRLFATPGVLEAVRRAQTVTELRDILRGQEEA